MSRVGIVLSGGGARGAYEVGVLEGLAEVLRLRERPLFQVVAGSSVGAINGAWLAAHAHRPLHDIAGLVTLWRGLSLSRHMKLDLAALLGGRGDPERLGRSLLDPRALEELVRDSIDWPQLHTNIERGVLRALVVSALHVGTGVTTLFTELAPGVELPLGEHPRRVTTRLRIEAEHVLASAAIPVLFPARRVGGAFFADGGLRFNTPISPALQAGADKLVVVTLRSDRSELPRAQGKGSAEEQYPSLVFLAGKVLDALLLDPVEEDLETLLLINGVVDALRTALGPQAVERFEAEVIRRRGHPYRQVETLRFRPSRDIGVLAGEHLREHGSNGLRMTRVLLARAAQTSATWEADLASYLMFDGSWASRLLELGRADAISQRECVRAFFDGSG